LEEKTMKKAQIVFLAFCVVSMALIFSCASSAPAGGGSWSWRVEADESSGGSSTITMKEETLEGLPGYSFNGAITHKYEYGYVDVKVTPDDAMMNTLKKAKAISFRFMGNGERAKVKIPTSDVKDYAYFLYEFDTVDGQPQTVIVPIAYLMQPSWGKAVGAAINLDLAEWVEFEYQGPVGPYAFKIWDLRVHTKGVPKESDVLPKGAAKPAAAGKAAAAEVPVGGDLLEAFKEVTLTDNFEYGDNYQAVLTDKRLFNGHKVVPGETYTLKITYTASRDLENVVEVGLVDPSSAANYWRPLTFRNGSKTGDPDGMAVIKQSKAGETVSATIKMTTTAGATSAAASCNALVFGTVGAGRKGTKGSGVQKAVKLTFTEFVFTKD
jgi:hypothetical protein